MKWGLSTIIQFWCFHFFCFLKIPVNTKKNFEQNAGSTGNPFVGPHFLAPSGPLCPACFLGCAGAHPACVWAPRLVCAGPGPGGQLFAPHAPSATPCETARTECPVAWVHGGNPNEAEK